VEVGFSPGGYAGWDDGCNVYGGKYVLQGNRLAFGLIESTEVACEGPLPRLSRVTGVAFEGPAMVLSTPGEQYVFRRNPYSVLTRRQWSLFSITDLETGETKGVEQFRLEYQQLLMETKADARFTFTDFDYSKWSGSMTVGPAVHALELAWDDRTTAALETRRRLAKHREIQRASTPYPLGVAAELDLTQVGAFCLVERPSTFGPSLMLELRGNRYVYTWSPR
jgi:hypothetical protein